MAELPERSLLVNVDSGLRQEHVSIHRAIGDVEGVQPVRPVPHTRRAAETLTSAEREELKRLRKEVREQQQTIEILKKATAFFVKENDR
ncbi:hypothetical protein LUR56_00295 [Streptomyces sp. MT29]|nr:hypothetical protein [Streptomyces sp. MT29]